MRLVYERAWQATLVTSLEHIVTWNCDRQTRL